jgi:acyl dehydratase
VDPEDEAMWSQLVGVRSEPVRNTIEAGAVRRFAEAIGDPNPLYLDEAHAAQSRWGRRIAPPTFPRVFDYGAVEGFKLPSSGVIHGDQMYTYTRPLFVGETLLCHAHFKETYEKRGREGPLTFLVFERFAVDAEGVEVMKTDEVYILTPAVSGKVG